MRFVSGWHSRGYLPHFDDGVSLQCVTYRLSDALPSHVLARLKDANHNDESGQSEIERYLDAGHGSCIFREPRNAGIVVANWHHFEPCFYHLHAWVVMPNHVHVLIEPNGRRSLSLIVQSWKSYTAKQMMPVGAPRRRLWQPDYWDRFIRNRHHFLAVVAYIHHNPVRAGLCHKPQDWLWSSAYCPATAEPPTEPKP